MNESRSHAQRLWSNTRQVSSDANALVGALEEMASEVEALVQEQIDERPYMTLAAAAAVGFVVGGGLATRMTKALGGIASRVAIAVAAREIGRRLGSSDDT